jgi:hypothetical protein
MSAGDAAERAAGALDAATHRGAHRCTGVVAQWCTGAASALGSLREAAPALWSLHATPTLGSLQSAPALGPP